MAESHTDSSDNLTVKTAQDGFYAGYNTFVALGAKLIVLALIVWAGIFPSEAGAVLLKIQNWTTGAFGAWYIWITAFFAIVCLGIAIWPRTGKIKLGQPGEKPEFSSFSWFSMMFGAGIGVGMLTFSTAEPIYHFANNPDVIKGLSDPQAANNVRNAYKWAFLHYGITPWACYGIVGMALAYFSYNRKMPLSFRSALRPLFGKAVEGPLGDVVDIVAILATIIGVGVTIGFGVSQFASGVYNFTGFSWISAENGKPTLIAQLLALLTILGASILSAMSGVNKGIKWLSNINMGLSFFLLAFFLIFGATMFAFKQFFVTIWDYIIALPAMSFTVWPEAALDGKLADWQAAWSIFYWAWWIAFAPFVGLFLARVSRGRSIREYVLGAMLVPALMGLTWFVLVGGTAIDLELSGIANGSIVNADISAQLYQTINLMLSPLLAKLMSFVIVILLLTYLVTSADSAILVINTIASVGNRARTRTKHIIIWGLIYMSLVAALLIAGGMEALKSAMIVGALPFSFVMALMAVSLIKALITDRRKVAVSDDVAAE